MIITFLRPYSSLIHAVYRKHVLVIFLQFFLMIAGIGVHQAIANSEPPSDMMLWLKADAGVKTEMSPYDPWGPLMVTGWEDQSFRKEIYLNHCNPMDSTISLFGLSSDGMPPKTPLSLSFMGGRGFFMNNFMPPWDAMGMEYFVLMKNYPMSYGAPFNLGHMIDPEFNSMNIIRDGFGTGSPGMEMYPAQFGLNLENEWRIYNVSAGFDSWRAYLDGQMIGQMPGEPFMFAPWNCYIGMHPGWRGEIAELIIYDRILNDEERKDVTDYLRSRLDGNFLSAPSGFMMKSLDFFPPFYVAVGLVWNHDLNSNSYYEVERRTVLYGDPLIPGGDTIVYIIQDGGFNDAEVQPGVIYAYRIREVRDGQFSNYSEEIIVEIPVWQEIPESPQCLEARISSPDTITLSWNRSATPGVLYVISVCPDFIPAVEIAVPDNHDDPFTCTYQYKHSSPGSVLGFFVRAVKNDLYSDNSNWATIITHPPVPKIVSAGAVSANTVRLTWEGPQNPNIRSSILFEIERRLDGVTDEFFHVGIVNGTSNSPMSTFEDTNLLAGGNYVYRIRAYYPSVGYSDFTSKIVIKLPSEGVSQPPLIRISLPADGTEIAWNQSVQFEAVVDNEIGGISPVRVEFYRNGMLFGSLSGAPYVLSPQILQPGAWVLTAKVVSLTGESRWSEPVQITVNSPGANDELSSISPCYGANQTSLSAPMQEYAPGQTAIALPFRKLAIWQGKVKTVSATGLTLDLNSQTWPIAAYDSTQAYFAEVIESTSPERIGRIVAIVSLNPAGVVPTSSVENWVYPDDIVAIRPHITIGGLLGWNDELPFFGGDYDIVSFQHINVSTHPLTASETISEYPFNFDCHGTPYASSEWTKRQADTPVYPDRSVFVLRQSVALVKIAQVGLVRSWESQTVALPRNSIQQISVGNAALCSPSLLPWVSDTLLAGASVAGQADRVYFPARSERESFWQQYFYREDDEPGWHPESGELSIDVIPAGGAVRIDPQATKGAGSPYYILPLPRGN